jgi:hypothetical protein
MPLSPESERLFRQLMSRRILDRPNISLRSMEAPKPADRTGPSDFANYLLTHTSGDKKTANLFGKSLASREGAESEQESMLSRLWDTLLTPNYTAANIGSALADGQDEDEGFLENLGDEISGIGKAVVGGGMELTDNIFGAGLQKLPFIGDNFSDMMDKGQKKFPLEKKTFEGVLHEDFGIDNKFARYGGGLALDIATDPLTFVGGWIGKGQKAIDQLDAKAAVPESLMKRGTEYSIGPRGRPEIRIPSFTPKAPVAEDALQGSAIPNLANNLPDLQHVDLPINPLDEVIPRSRQLRREMETGRTAKAQGISDRLGTFIRTGKFRDLSQKWKRANNDWQRALMRAGVVAESPTKFSVRAANDIISKIESGALPRVTPKPPSATGELAVRAKDFADDFIDELKGPKRIKGRYAKRNVVVEVNPGQQVNMFAKLTAEADDLDEVVAMVRTAEDHMISLGVQPIWHNGIRVRLSDVLEATKDQVPLPTVLNSFKMSNTAKMDPVVRAAIHGLSAQRSLNMSDIVANLSKYATQAKDDITEHYMGVAKTRAEGRLVDTSVKHAVRMGMTNKEADSIQDLIKDIVNVDKLPADKWIEVASAQLMKAFKEEKVSGELISKFNNKVAESLGITQGNIATKISGSNVADSIMTRVATWWGKGEFQKVAHSVFVWGERNAEMRAATMRKIAKNYSKDEIKTAWKVVAGTSNEVNDPRIMEVVTQFQNYMTQVLKVPSYGAQLVNEGNKAVSVAERSMMLMEDINRHLVQMNGSKAFQFSKKQFDVDAWGVKRDFSMKTGEGWQTSWSKWDPDDPLKLMYDIDLAMERATKEYAFLDDFVEKFGSLTKDATHNFAMPNSRIKDFYVPEELGRQMLRTINDIHKGMFKPSSEFGRYYMRALRAWKTGVTIYLPSHHIRNAIGDMYLMWNAGHNNPYAFIWGKRIMHSQRTRYQNAIKSGNWDELAKLTDPQAARWAATEGKDVIFKVNGINVTAEELYVGAHQRGLLLDANRLEDIFGETVIKWEPFGGKVHGAASTAAEVREHFIRLSHFAAAVDKGLKKSKDLNKIMDDAAFEVRKWHPDGRDLTYFEQKNLRTMVPFYSWIRKSTPLLVESLVQRPAKALMYPRGMVGLQQMLGIDASMADPFPNDQLFPEWIRGYGIGPVGDPDSDNSIARWWGLLGRNMIGFDGQPEGYTVINPSNPLIDSGQQFMGFGPKDTVAGIYDSIGPALKVPMDLFKNSDFTGAPITKDEGGRGVLHYLSKQVPLISPVQRITDLGDKERKGKEPGYDSEALINILTALGIHGTGPYQKGAEFEARERMRRLREGN